MIRIVSGLPVEPVDWLLLVAAGAICVLAAFGASVLIRRARGRRSTLLAIAINNMSQGLVMFDAAERMVLCNTRYLQLYGLSPAIVKPGCKLIDVIRHRFATGSIGGDCKFLL